MLTKNPEQQTKKQSILWEKKKIRFWFVFGSVFVRFDSFEFDAQAAQKRTKNEPEPKANQNGSLFRFVFGSGLVRGWFVFGSF